MTKSYAFVLDSDNKKLSPTPEQKAMATEIAANFKKYKDLANEWRYWFGMTDASIAIVSAEEAGMGSAKATDPEKPDIPAKTENGESESADTDNGKSGGNSAKK